MKKYISYLLLLFSSLAEANQSDDFKEKINKDYVFYLTEKGALSCLAHTMYEEANVESVYGRELVGISLLNRAVFYKKSICSLIKEKHQFSFYHKGFLFNKLTETLREKEAIVFLYKALRGELNAHNGITHFHNMNVSPSFSNSKDFKFIVKEKNHKFYADVNAYRRYFKK